MSCPPEKFPTNPAAERVDICSPCRASSSYIGEAATGRKCHTVNASPSRKSTTTTLTSTENAIYENQQQYPPHFKVEEDVVFNTLERGQSEIIIKEEETNESEYVLENQRETSEEDESVKQEKFPSEKEFDHVDSEKTECIDSLTNVSVTEQMPMIDDSCENSTVHQENDLLEQHVETAVVSLDRKHQTSRSHKKHQRPIPILKRKSFTLGDVFCDIFTHSLKLPYCPLSLAKAVVSVMHKELTTDQASIIYCVCSSRLRMSLSCISSICRMYENGIKDSRLLREVRRYSAYDAVEEWLLRMRRMGRSPVIADAHLVSRYLGKTIQNFIVPIDCFVRLYGESAVSLEEWVFPTQVDAAKWHTLLREHLYVCCGMKPNDLLTSKNSIQVFTSTEVLVSLGDSSKEVIITRGRSNLYCLTHCKTGVYRAILTFSAAGQFHPPAILQKGYDLPHWALNEESVDLIASPNGKLDPVVFLGWLRRFEQRLSETGVPRPVVLFVHGHAAHGSPAVDSFCHSKGIILHSHHHSPINLMDPFIHLLSPLLYHLDHTQDQLITLTNTRPLPDYLLPSVLSDAWTQVSQEKLAEEAFRRSGILPYDHTKCFAMNKSIQIAAFPLLILEPFKTYFCSSDLPQEDLFEYEPQISSTYHLRTRFNYCLDSSHDKLEDEEEKNTDDLDIKCDPLYIGPDDLCESSLMESDSVSHIHKGFLKNVKSSIEDLAEDYSEEGFDELPLICNIEEPETSLESLQTCLSPDQCIKMEPDQISNSIHSDLSLENLSEYQPQSMDETEFECGSPAFVSPLQNPSECENQTEETMLLDDINIKEEIEEVTVRDCN